jgi:hypothetical protein
MSNDNRQNSKRTNIKLHDAMGLHFGESQSRLLPLIELAATYDSN